MVGIRSPIGLVVGSCTSHPGVLGSIPKREEQTGAPCVKVPGSSRVRVPPCVKVPGSSRVPDRGVLPLRYGEAQAAAASWRAHDGRRQRGTACPHLFRYHLTHTYCSLARLPPTHPFVGVLILQRHFQVPCRARLPPPRVLLSHTCTQDGWFLQPKRRPARLPHRTVPSNCICRCSRMRVRLPLHILLLHTQVSRSAHTYRGYASFRDICGAWFGFGSGFGIGFTLSSHTPPRTRSPSSRHPPFTHYPFPPR